MMKRVLSSLAVALALLACSEGGSTAPDQPSAQSEAEADLVGVWQGSLGGGEANFFFALQPNGIAYFADTWDGGLTRGQWRLDGERLLISGQFIDQTVTFVAKAEGDTIEGAAPEPDGDGEIPFSVSRMGAWASAGETNPAAGFWLVDMQNTQDDESNRCGLVIQPDNRALMACVSALMRGLWTAGPNGLRIELRYTGEGGSDQIVLTGAFSGQQPGGIWSYEDGGGTFTARRAP